MNIKEKHHHLFFGKPEEERRTNRGECAYPYACDICCQQRIEFITGYRIDAVKWDADKQRKAGLHQQTETERIRNQHRPAALLYGNTGTSSRSSRFREPRLPPHK